MADKPSKLRRVLKGVAYASVLGLALGTGAVWRLVSGSKVIHEAVEQTIARTQPKDVFGKDALTILVLGCDEDLYTGGYKNKKGRQVRKGAVRSDTILLARVDFKSGTLTGLSVPRDTECTLPGFRTTKINAYHAIAGEGQADRLTQRAVEHLLTGVHVDRVVSLDYTAFQKVVDLVGGVKVDVDRRMKYTDRAGGLFIDLKPGPGQLLNGYDAMGFVRYRHGDSDFKRQERQKRFLMALKDAVIARPARIGQVADEAVAALGGGLTTREAVALARFGQGLKPAAVRMGMVPVVEGRGTNLIIDQRKTALALREFGMLPKA